MRVVFICQAVDLDDPVLPTTVRWIDVLARKPQVEHVRVLALRTGRYELPDNVSVQAFGGSGRLATLGRFYRAVARAARRRPDIFFIYQGGPYPALLMPFKLLMRTPIVQWKAHAVVTRAMALYARWCNDLVFTAARASFPMDLPNVRVLGHGIDTGLFRVDPQPRLGDLITTGRIAPVKRLDQMIGAVVHANRAHGAEYRLNIFGPTLDGDAEYAAKIERLIDSSGARDWVTLHGPVPQERLPALLGGHRALLNFATGAIDKSVLEAMACGLPVISTNDSAAEILPADLRPMLVPDASSTELQAGTIHDLLSRPDPELARLGQELRAVVEREHSVDRLFDRILREIQALPGVRA